MTTSHPTSLFRRLLATCTLISITVTALPAFALQRPGTVPLDEMKPPPNPVPPRFDSTAYAPTREEQQEIDTLVKRLVEIDSPDFGMAPLMSGTAFAPVKTSRQFSMGVIMIDHELKTSDMVERLVAFGPKALPALVDSVEDATPTKLTMTHNGGYGAMWYSREVELITANPHESPMPARHPRIVRSDMEEPNDILSNTISTHTMTRGDVCFLIIGQIVNRGYQPSRYQPSSCQVINSPTQSPEIAAIVRDLWKVDDPAQTLFESLYFDCASPLVFWPSRCTAATRLLYYFPDQSAPFIARCIDEFDIGGPDSPPIVTDEEWERRWAVNGVPADEFIAAVTFADHPVIRDSLVHAIERTNEARVLTACLTDEIAASCSKLILERMKAIIAQPLSPSAGPFGGEYLMLCAAAHYYPEDSPPLFETYLAHDTLACRRAVIHALDSPAEPNSWAVGFLAPLLDDQTDTGWTYGADNNVRWPIRVCDEAASAIVQHLPDSTFAMEGPPRQLDEQIKVIRSAIARQTDK